MYENISAFDAQRILKFIKTEKNLTVNDSIYQETIAVHAKTRNQFNKHKLKWRISNGSRKSLGWIPFKTRALKLKDNELIINKHKFNVWDSYGLQGYDLRSGSFNCDARGRWYVNIVVSVPIKNNNSSKSVGIDLGCKDIATCSDGKKLNNKKIYYNHERALGIAQKANKKKLIKTIHAKIKNSRKDYIHKFTTSIAKNHKLIVVGNISSSTLTKTKMAKAVLDASWFTLKTQLNYKSIGMSAKFVEVNESYTTQICSCCGLITCNSPKGMNGLGIREWTCAKCGTKHDRDVNAAKNILQLGYGLPVEGFSC